MALIQCPECEQRVSTTAASCPHCGCDGALLKAKQPSSPPPLFYYLLGDDAKGPFALESIQDLIDSGELPSSVPVARDADEEWRGISAFNADGSLKTLLPIVSAESSVSIEGEAWRGSPPTREFRSLGPVSPVPALSCCPACKSQVATDAARCPHCGKKLRDVQSAIGIVAAIVIGLILSGLLMALLAGG